VISSSTSTVSMSVTRAVAQRFQRRSPSRRAAQVVLTLVSAIALHGAATATAAAKPAPVPASASAAAAGFQDPTKNVRCAVKGSAVICLIRHQDKATCGKLFTASGTLKKHGPAVMNFGCFPTSPFAATRFTTLAYGKRKTIGGVTCVVTKKTGMKCTNADKHGFSLTRKGSTSF
jgi:hypothetical protein